MKRVRVLFAIPFLLLALPLWRAMDLLALVAPAAGILATCLAAWGLFCLILPAYLIRPKVLPWIALATVVIIVTSAALTGPLSGMATDNPRHSHCGALTYTGALYPLIGIMTQAPADDLEARNQLCWVRKLIQRVPDRIESTQELQAFLDLARNKLLAPDNKYRVVLPLVALYHFTIFAQYDDSNATGNFTSGKALLESQKFWIEQYTVEISSRDYGWWDFPYGPWIKFEYGIIERNWESIVASIITEPSR